MRLIIAMVSVAILIIAIFTFTGSENSDALNNQNSNSEVVKPKSKTQIDNEQAISTSKKSDTNVEGSKDKGDYVSSAPSTIATKGSQKTRDFASSKNLGSNPTVGMPAGILMRKVDVGPGSSSFGHTPVKTFKSWPGGSEIRDGIIPRDTDGWLRIRGYQFSGSIKLSVGNVKIIDSKFLPGNQTGVQKESGGCYGNNGMIFSSSTPPDGELVLDHVLIDQGQTGWALGGINVYLKTTVRYSHIKGPKNSIRAMSNSLYEHNYLESTGAPTECKQGSYNGIKGNYQKVNWTARHNTIISAVGVTTPSTHWGASCIHNDVQGGTGARLSYGILVENNYCNGFRWGITLDGTNSKKKNLVRNNFFGTDFTDNGSGRLRISSEYSHSIVENNNVINMDFVESIGSVRSATKGLLPELSI